MGMLDGRVVLVTGGGRGLGRAHCLELASHGATVVVNDLAGEQDVAAEVAGEIEALGGAAMSDGSSVSDFTRMGELIGSIVDRYGRLDAVVNNAGILRDRMLTNMTEAEFDAVIAVHVKGNFCVTQHAAAHWRAVAKAGGTNTGRIINTTSGAGLWGNLGQFNYAGAKAAIVGMTTVAAMELGRIGVTANAVSPIARTGMTAGLGWDGGAGEFDRLDPANASPVIAWLASEESGWLTGGILRVDGDTVIRVKPFEMDPAVHTRTGARGTRLDATLIDTALRQAYGLRPGGIPSAD